MPQGPTPEKRSPAQMGVASNVQTKISSPQTESSLTARAPELKNSSIGHDVFAEKVRSLGDLLPQETVETFIHTSQKYFRMRAFTKVIQGETKLIILLGETHAKDEAAFNQGTSLNAAFTYTAFEGAPKYLAHDALNLCTSIIRRCGNLFRFNLQYGSNIDQVINDDGLKEMSKNMVKLVAHAIKQNGLSASDNGNWKDIHVVEFSGKKWSMQDIAGLHLEQGGSKVIGAEIIKEAFATAASTQGLQISSFKERKDFHLEKDHKKTLGEELAAAYVPATLLVSTALIVSMILAEGTAAKALRVITPAWILIPVAVRFAAGLLKDRLHGKSWFPYLVSGLAGELERRRTKTMVETTNEIFANNPEVDKLLVKVGRMHVAGISKALTQKHGWIELAVPGQKAGY